MHIPQSVETPDGAADGLGDALLALCCAQNVRRPQSYLVVRKSRPPSLNLIISSVDLVSITRGDTVFPGRFSLRSHQIHMISTPLLSCSIHDLLVPGLLWRGAECLTNRPIGAGDGTSA